MTNKEVFVPIKGYEGLYEISSTGRVKALPKPVGTGRLVPEKFLKPMLSWLGYQRVCLCKYGIRKLTSVHRLVAIHFLFNPENKPQVNHMNGIKTDNTILNLEWCTSQENNIHALENRLRRMDDDNKPILQFSKKGDYIERHESAVLAAKKMNFREDASHGLRQCARGDAKTAYGYRWIYENRFP